MRCPACTRDNPDDARFCAHCGARLVPQVPTEERKVVSILFCDLVDSTAHAGSRDPEEWRETVRQYFSVVRTEIERYGGTVEKFIGDAVMAVFGLPRAHEDDPERVVRAALRIVRPLEGYGQIASRIGIATGEVVADPAAAEKGEFLVTGGAVNLAARLQSAAAPHTILVDSRTWRNVHHIAKGESKGALALKGFAQPIEVWQVLDASLTAPARGVGGLRAPLLGRDEELALLAPVLQRVRRDGRTALVTLVGEAGVGKSRLFDEFRARLPMEVRVLKGRCLPYGSEAAFSALADALKREAEIEDTDSHETARDKLRRFATGAFATDPDAVRLTTHVIHALGLSEGPPAFPITRADLVAALTRLLASLARTETVVIGLEDIHWADDGLLDFLGELSLRPPAAHLCIVCLARPLLLDRRPDWGSGRRNVALVYLDPLPPGETRRLLAELLAAELPDEVAAQVLTRAEGNPFFVEEILRMLIAEGQLVQVNGRWTAGVTEVRIPDTVQGVIAARLDQLAQSEKRATQDAAVVGRIFWLQPLYRLEDGGDVSEVVGRLELKELVAERPHSTIHGDREYVFRHVLIRDVAYSTIPKAQRLVKHRVVADWLAEVTRDRVDEFADLLAYHYEQAQAWREAFVYTLRLANRGFALDTYRQALVHYHRAAKFGESADLTSEERIHLLTQRGWTFARLAEYGPALADLAAARDLARNAGAGTWEVQALLGMAWVQGHGGGDYEANSKTATEALAIARRLDAPRLIVECLLDLGSCFHNLGQVNEGLAAFNEAAEVSAKFEYERGTVHAMRGWVMQDVGLLQEAIAYHRQAIVRARAIGERRIEAANLNYLSHAMVTAGRAREALQLAETATQFSVASGDRYREQYSRYQIAFAALRLGAFGRAIEEANAALALARSFKDYEVIGYVGGLLTELYARIGDTASALAYEGEVLDAIGRVITMPRKGNTLGSIGTARLFRGDLVEARAIFTEASRSRFALWGPPEGLWGVGMVSVREGRLDEAQRHADALEALARPREMRSVLARAMWIRAAAARAQASAVDVDEAIRIARESEELPLLHSLLTSTGSGDAKAVAEQIGASIPDLRLRESFLKTPPL